MTLPKLRRHKRAILDVSADVSNENGRMAIASRAERARPEWSFVLPIKKPELILLRKLLRIRGYCDDFFDLSVSIV